MSISISTKKNRQVHSSCACAYAYVVALTSENRVDISTRISTRPWTNHRPLWPRLHVNISKAIWRAKRPPSCLPSGLGELVIVNRILIVSIVINKICLIFPKQKNYYCFSVANISRGVLGTRVNPDTCRIRVDVQNSIWIRMVWTWKCLNPERKSCELKNILIHVDGA